MPRSFVDAITSTNMTEKALVVLSCASLVADAWKELTPETRESIRQSYNGYNLADEMNDLLVALARLQED